VVFRLKRLFVKIISVLAAFTIVFSVMPVSAFSAYYQSKSVSWWDFYIYKGISKDTNVPLWDAVCNGIAGHLSGAVCAGASPDKLHHGSVVNEGSRGGVDKDGRPLF